MINLEELTPLIERWLPAQRWFAGKGRAAHVEAFALQSVALDPVPVELWVARVHYDDGTLERYQLPLVVHQEPVEALDHVLLGSIKTGDDPPIWVYDALHDKDATLAFLHGVRDARQDQRLIFRRYVEQAEVPAEGASLVLTGEQSNTSLIFDDKVILKVYRRLQPGIHPDIEIHAALGERGSRHVARLLGSIHAHLDDEDWALGMLQEYLSTATDGWELAKASVRDLMAERDLHAEEAGGDFAAESHRLGAAVAETHADLVAAFGTATAADAELPHRAQVMAERLDRAVGLVPELGPLADGLRSAYTALAGLRVTPALQRIHGDLHLGQALRTVRRWVIIDFEGEPMNDLSARREPDLALRDIAGMLRSFEYAAHHRVVETGPDAQLSYRAGEWAGRNRNAFCTGYAQISGHDPREQEVVLRAFEADKAVYEALYEARNRPSWLPIPLASLTRIADEEGS